MSDLIDRAATIARLTKVPGVGHKALDMVRDLPATEPPKGFWVTIERGEQGYSAGDFRCSICGKPNKCYTMTAYCPNCGAKMEGKE